MISSMTDLTYQERLDRLGLTTLEDRRKRGDLITVYKQMVGMERLDRDDWIVWDEREQRGHGRKLKRTRCRKDIKKYSFPYRCVDDWNKLSKEVVEGKSIQSFKRKLDEWRHGDRTVRA